MGKVLQFPVWTWNVTQNHQDMRKDIATVGRSTTGGRQAKEIIATFKQKMGYGAKPPRCRFSLEAEA